MLPRKAENKRELAAGAIKATEVPKLWDVSLLCLLIGLEGLQGYCLVFVL